MVEKHHPNLYREFYGKRACGDASDDKLDPVRSMSHASLQQVAQTVCPLVGIKGKVSWNGPLTWQGYTGKRQDTRGIEYADI